MTMGDLAPSRYDSLSIAFAMLRAFVNEDREAGADLAQILLEESDSAVRALEVVADSASAALRIIGHARDFDVDVALGELAKMITKRFDD